MNSIIRRIIDYKYLDLPMPIFGILAIWVSFAMIFIAILPIYFIYLLWGFVV